MSDDLTARDVIARALDEHLSDGEGRPFPAAFHGETDAVLAALAAAGYTIVTIDSLTSGICGDRAPTMPDQPIICILPAGHAGWHGNGRGMGWTGEVVPDAR